MKKLCTLILLISACITAKAQGGEITPQVINSGGSHRTDNFTGISLTDNIGEPFVQTVGPAMNVMITQGFLQPFITVPGFSLDILKNDEACIERKDGKISFDINTVYPKNKYVFTTVWLPEGTCPDNNCQSLDSLASGDYTVTAYFTYTNSANFVRKDSAKTIITINPGLEECIIKIYTGFSPIAGSSIHNWHIGNIDMFPKNKVSIYNRWGNELFNTDNYTNEDPEKSFPRADQYDKLTSGTYFYIIDLGDGTKLRKGWVELIKN